MNKKIEKNKKRNTIELMNVKEVSEKIQVKESTLYSWASKGKIPCHKLNGLLRFDQKEIENWVKKSKVVPVSMCELKPNHIEKKDLDLIIKTSIESIKSQSYNSLKRGTRPKSLERR